MNHRTLVVDLDGTLIKSDTLFESVTYLIFHRPLLIGKMFFHLLRGKTSLKRFLSANVSLDMNALAKRPEVEMRISEAKQAQRRVVLATASHFETVKSFAAIFDEILATRDEKNLKGQVKAELLVEKFGIAGFDYIGDSSADSEVWKFSHTAILVGKAARHPNWAAGSEKIEVVDHELLLVKSWLRELRPHQWAKNLLVFAPLVMAGAFFEPIQLFRVIIAFFVFCLVASATYILNDLADLGNDRMHHRKKFRPIAASLISIPAAWVSAFTLLLVAAGTTLLLNSVNFGLALTSYFVLTLAYSLTLKKVAILDAVALGVLYSLRLIAGAAVINLPSTFWLLTFSMFFFFSLALMKRYSELFDAARGSKVQILKGRGYQTTDLELVSTLGVSSGVGAILLMSLYLYFGPLAVVFSNYLVLWIIVPIALMWIARAWLISHRGMMDDDPVLFAIKDRFTWISLGCVGALSLYPIFMESF